MSDLLRIVPLSRFGAIRFAGVDAETFLQGQVSCDVAGLEAGVARRGSYCNPQGRMIATFLMWRDDAGFLMMLPRALRAAVQKRLSMYVLRSRVQLSDHDHSHGLLGIFGSDASDVLKAHLLPAPAAPLEAVHAGPITVICLTANRYLLCAPGESLSGLRDAIGPRAAAGSEDAWDYLEICAGVAWITPATQGEFVPQMANLDLTGGISFTKGCYPGQEIVARMHYLGRLKQRMYRAHLPAAAQPPAPGDRLYASGLGEQACGMIVNATPAPGGGHEVLAVIQMDSAARAKIHHKGLTGPELLLLELPYQVPKT